MLKLVERNSDVYKPMTKKNSIVLYSRAFAIREHHYWLYNIIHIQEKRDSKIMLENFGYNKGFITHCKWFTNQFLGQGNRFSKLLIQLTPDKV